MKLWQCVILSVFIEVVHGQASFTQSCADAPTPSLRQTCINLQLMAANSRRQFQEASDNNSWPYFPAHLRPSPLPFRARGQFADNPLNCMTLICLCPFFFGRLNQQNHCILRNGQPLMMAYRKEYRILSEDERNRWHNALNAVKRSGLYDQMAAEHMQIGTGSGAHSGPGFLPWHREFLKRFEIAIRLVDPTIAIPYWDSVMDSYLPDPRDSILFSSLFFGENDAWGNVVSGPYAFWRTIDGRNAIVRNLAQEGALFTEFGINQVMMQRSVEYVLSYTAPLQGCPFPINFAAIEYTHSNVHLWIGGHMKPPEMSANDPTFYTLHSFIDFIWEIWRSERQPEWIRDSMYPPDLPQCSDPQHFSYAPMRPYYHLSNRDGLSNLYTSQLYRYSSRPTCTWALPTCSSQYLFCDARGQPHCVSKIKLFGNCFGFEGLDACFNGVCQMGRCVPGPTPRPFVLPTTTVATTRRQRILSSRIETTRNRKGNRNCYNLDPCCETWNQYGLCEDRNNTYVQENCPAACGICRPRYNPQNECTDRHQICALRGASQCTGDSGKFMAENCRTTCNLCNMPKSSSCRRFN